MENILDSILIGIRNNILEKGYALVGDLTSLQKLYIHQLKGYDYILLSNHNEFDFEEINNNTHILLDNQGLLRLFILDNREKYNEFLYIIKLHGYTEDDLYRYLFRINLSNDIKYILNLNNFINYTIDMDYNELDTKINKRKSF